MRFPLESLQVMQKCVPLHCVFHSIRFKVNKRLEYSGTPFFMPFRVGGLFKHGVTEIQSSFLRTVVLFPYCPPSLLSLVVPNLLCVERFDDDAVGADLRVRPDADVDVSRHW